MDLPRRIGSIASGQWSSDWTRKEVAWNSALHDLELRHLFDYVALYGEEGDAYLEVVAICIIPVVQSNPADHEIPSYLLVRPPVTQGSRLV